VPPAVAAPSAVLLRFPLPLRRPLSDLLPPAIA
jgi:hypothetical protein